MKQKILITGGFGFVGSKLVELLSKNTKYSITIVDNLLSGNALQYKFILADVRDKAAMKRIVPKHDVIIHLAAIVGEPACILDPNFAYNVNVGGTRNILDVMSDNQKIIFTSTSSVYGNRPNERVTELSQPLPTNNYARHKYYAEMDIIEGSSNYIILRPVTAFGVTERTRMDLLVNSLIYEGLSYGRIKVYEPNIMRPIIHVNDFARVLRAALEGDLGINQVYNIGDSTYTMTKLQLAEQIASLCGATIEHVDGSSLDLRNYDVSFDKLYKTGFVCGPARLPMAVQQIKAVQYEVSKNMEQYTTPYQVKQFLAKDGK